MTCPASVAMVTRPPWRPPVKRRIRVAPVASIRETEQYPTDEFKDRAFARLIRTVEYRYRTFQWAEAAVD